MEYKLQYKKTLINTNGSYIAKIAIIYIYIYRYASIYNLFTNVYNTKVLLEAEAAASLS